MRRNSLHLTLAALVGLAIATSLPADAAPMAPVNQRYNDAEVTEVPDFQKHVSPLLGRLGCNGRACHGSFQGRGGFQLSLFGYDFKTDHDALLENERVNVEDPMESLIIVKPTDADEHEGGKRYEKDSWQYHVLRRWVEDGAKIANPSGMELTKVAIEPAEIVFKAKDETVQLKVIAHWEDGTVEDVTPLCRFQTNNDRVADIDENGLTTAVEPGDTHIVVFYDNAVQPIPVMRPVSDKVGEQYPEVATPTKVDELVVEKLRKLGVVPSDLCTDAEFLRRVSLDLAGTLPTAKQVQQFLADESPDKRADKIEELLNSPGYAAWWTTKLCDFTGNNDYQLRNFLPQMRGQQGSSSGAWYGWIHKRVKENVAYDDLCEGIVLAKSRQEGQAYTEYCEQMSDMYREGSGKTFADCDSMPLYWARREFRDAEPRAINFAYAFLGIRIQCAQCHKHPFDQWSKNDFAEFTNFFRTVVASNGRPADKAGRAEYEKLVAALNVDSKLRGGQLRREMGRLLGEGKTVPFPEVFAGGAPRRSRGNDAAQTEMTSAKILGGEAHDLERGQDIRQPLMDWLRGDKNPYFARAFVNRVWASYFHRGIVDPPDDNSLANPPVNKPLLDYLAKGFIESGFDMKWVHRTIANSRTYQLSWQPNDTNAGDETNFSRAVPRRLPAEVFYDALVQATANDQKASELHQDADGRAIAIPGAGNRYNNRAGAGAAFALQVFGRSTRENNCDCDRSMDPSLLQTVYLQNDNDVLSMMDRRGDGWLAQVAVESGLKPPAAAAANNRNSRNNQQQIKNQVQKLKRNIKQLRNDGKDEQAKRLQTRLDAFIARAKKGLPPQRRKVDESKKSDIPGDGNNQDDKVNAVALVQQAYLRTVSRYPDQRELNRGVTYIQDSEDKLNGVRGLLWALVNTKEFIVNH